jgi:hypothetical protein
MDWDCAFEYPRASLGQTALVYAADCSGITAAGMQPSCQINLLRIPEQLESKALLGSSTPSSCLENKTC